MAEPAKTNDNLTGPDQEAIAAWFSLEELNNLRKMNVAILSSAWQIKPDGTDFRPDDVLLEEFQANKTREIIYLSSYLQDFLRDRIAEARQRGPAGVRQPSGIEFLSHREVLSRAAEAENEQKARNNEENYVKTPYTDNNEAQHSSLEAPEDLSKTKTLDSAENIRPEFSRSLDRAAAAEAMAIALEESGLSQRKFAEQLGVPHTDLQRVLKQTATLEKSLELLSVADSGFQAQLVRN